MPVTFGGLRCLDPHQEEENCLELGYPLDPQWWGQANRFRSTLGREPGKGRLLMAYSDVTSLNTNTLYNLVFTDGDPNPGTRRQDAVTLLSPVPQHLRSDRR
jgi:hypothetical protein